MIQELARPRGLEDAEAARRLARFGPNAPPSASRRSWLQIALEALREPMFGLLIAAALLYLALGNLNEGLFLTAGAGVSIGLLIMQEARSERALAALRALAVPDVRVIRGGEERRISDRDLVPGDLIVVSEGERLAADAVLVEGDVLHLDESVLTGESAPVTRRPMLCEGEGGGQEAMSLLQAGALVLQGSGLAEVVRTGAATALGQIGSDLARIEETPSPLQIRTKRLVAWLGGLALGFCVLVTLVISLREGDWLEGGLSGITVAIALIPEEFPMVLAIFFALGSWRLARRQVLVRRTAAIETLGAASILCVDKTGTLTRNQMSLARLWPEGERTPLTPDQAAKTARALLGAAILASNPRSIDPMDRALWTVGGDLSDRPLRLARSWPLRPDRLAVIQLWEGEGRLRAAAKGAPEAIFDMCDLSPARREALVAAQDVLAAGGMRVLAVAQAQISPPTSGEPDDWPFTYLGLLGFLDPLREDAVSALTQARDAGIKVAMITGDYRSTALEIARQAGIDVAAGVLLGREIDAMSRADLQERVRRVRVFARVRPDQKLALVEALKASGEVVVMTGDGVNDAPALEAAHVGVAMGGRGSAVAREAADIVLLDDSFASIVGGVRLGRRIFANLRKALGYITAIHVPIAGLALTPLLLGWPPMLLPMHVVVLELLIDPISSLSFEAEPSDPQAMRQPPRPITEPLFGARQMLGAALRGLVIFAAVLAIYGVALDQHGQSAARGAAFAALILANLALAYASAATGRVDPFHPARAAFWTICAVAVIALAIAYAIAPIAQILRIAPPSAALWMVVLPAALLAGAWPLLLRPFIDSIRPRALAC